MSTVPVTPLPYRDSDERESADESATREALSTDMREILETTWADHGHAVRSVHAKSHALIDAALEVSADLPGPLAQGLFARAGNYPVVMRLSTNPGDVLDDSVSAPRGLAIKIHGVERERLPGSEDASTQDFRLRTPRSSGPRTRARTSRSGGSSRRRSRSGARRARGPSTTGSRSARGTGWRPTARSARSTAPGTAPTPRRRGSAARATAARCTSRARRRSSPAPRPKSTVHRVARGGATCGRRPDGRASLKRGPAGRVARTNRRSTAPWSARSARPRPPRCRRARRDGERGYTRAPAARRRAVRP